MITWGKGESCPWCGKYFEVEQMTSHAIYHLKKGDKIGGPSS